MKKTALFFLTLIFLTFPHLTQARVSQEDIVNSRLETYNQSLSNFSPQGQQTVKTYTQKIQDLNKLETDRLEQIMIKQGQILDEYIRRQGYEEDGGADGINRNLSKPVENARYWLTYAHEAIAFQAAKTYLPSLGSEQNLKSSLISNLNSLQADINGLNSKVLKSQQIIKSLVQNQ